MSEKFIRVLKTMQRSMAEGIIDLLPDDYAMSVAEGRRQAETADELLGRAAPVIGRMLAEANYSLYFSNRTMSSGAELPEKSLDELVEGDTEEQMPHLTRTNLAIGQLVKGITEGHEGILRIIDSGSGTGATLAAIVAGASEGSRNSGLDTVSITGIESNPDFYASLQAFGEAAVTKLSEGGSNDAAILRLVQGDILESVRTMEPLPHGKKDVTVLTGNYVWHRLPTEIKDRLVREISERSSNSIILLADLMQNASKVNRQYFNFGNNGPLNCGNIGLQQMLESHGYVVRDTAVDGVHPSIHPKLGEKIRQEAANDGRLWIAYKGSEAERLIAA